MLKHFFEGFLAALVALLWFTFGCCVGVYYAFQLNWLIGVVTIAVNCSVGIGLLNVAQHLVFPEKERHQ